MQWGNSANVFKDCLPASAFQTRWLFQAQKDSSHRPSRRSILNKGRSVCSQWLSQRAIVLRFAKYSPPELNVLCKSANIAIEAIRAQPM
jgi:hypothetical protein